MRSPLQSESCWQPPLVEPPPPSPAPSHTPFWQLPLEQGVPSGFAGSEQLPLWQLPGSWHSSVALQTTGSAPLQLPAWQVSVWVQASLSSQLVPLSASQAPSLDAPATMLQA